VRIEGKPLKPQPEFTGTVVSMSVSMMYMSMSIVRALLGVPAEVRRVESILRDEVGGTRGMAGREPVLLLLLLLAAPLSTSQ